MTPGSESKQRQTGSRRQKGLGLKCSPPFFGEFVDMGFQTHNSVAESHNIYFTLHFMSLHVLLSMINFPVTVLAPFLIPCK